MILHCMINNVGTIYSTIGTQFFEGIGIPKDKITDFIVFVLKKNNLEKELKENNYSIIRNTMSDNVATFKQVTTKICKLDRYNTKLMKITSP